MPNGASINDYFEKIYASYEVGICKPLSRDYGAYHWAMLELDQSETLFIDDGPANTKVGRELGFVTYCPDNGED